MKTLKVNSNSVHTIILASNNYKPDPFIFSCFEDARNFIRSTTSQDNLAFSSVVFLHENGECSNVDYIQFYIICLLQDLNTHKKNIILSPFIKYDYISVYDKCGLLFTGETESDVEKYINKSYVSPDSFLIFQSFGESPVNNATIKLSELTNISETADSYNFVFMKASSYIYEIL